ncbi:MAG: hypothetical protein JXA03_06950 [Bacteroidales bacterium]|nr:hypothetical protein [Bacteroidales bacterium]
MGLSKPKRGEEPFFHPEKKREDGFIVLNNSILPPHLSSQNNAPCPSASAIAVYRYHLF